MKGEHLGWFLISASENEHSLLAGHADSGKDGGGPTLSSGTSGDDVEVVPSPAGPS